MLPIIASIGFFLGCIHGDASVGTLFAGGLFVALASMVFIGALRVVHDAEEAEPH
ncbi:MAG: hypothetical protein ABI591_25630 [Kofleriaceae bacterium]